MGEEIKMILQKGEYGILSTVGQDGKPYAVPLSYAWKDVNTPPETVPLDRTNGAHGSLKWCIATAAMVH